MSRSENFSSGYRGNHQPIDGQDAVGAHEVDKGFPDFYEHPEWYHHGGSQKQADRETTSALRSIRGNPDAQVTVYRAVPHGVTRINPGDWVSLSRSYAQGHGMHPDDPKQDMPVISMRVPARHVRESGVNSIHEWGYFPGKPQ